MLHGSHRLVFPLRQFDKEVGYLLGAVGPVPGVLRCQVMMVWAGLELLGGMGIILWIYSFPIFLRQQMGSVLLSHYAHMARGCWYCGFKCRTIGTTVCVESSIVHHLPYPRLRLVLLLPLHRGPYQNHHRLGMAGLVKYLVVQLCQQHLSVQGGGSCRMFLLMSLWCWTIRR